MSKVKKVTGLIFVAAIFATALYGCGGESPTAIPPLPTATTAAVAAPTDTTAASAAPTDTTAPVAGGATATTATTSGGGGTAGGSGDAASLLQQSDTAMKSVNSYHVVLKTSAGGVQTTGEGDFVKPDKMRMNLTTPAGQTQIIVIGGDMYTQVPGSDAYMMVPGAGAGLVQSASASAGLSALAQNATVVGDETLDGVATTHLKFSYSLDKAADQAAQAMGQPNATPSTGLGNADAEVWVEKSTGYIHQFSTTSTVAGTASSSTVTYSKFNEEVTPPIEKPANVQQVPSIPSITIPTIPAP